MSVALPVVRYPTASGVGCSRCPTLLAERTQIVDGAGPDRPSLLVVGEAPGADEDVAGAPFVGRSGQLLRASLGQLGLTTEQIRFTNAVRCRPPLNRTPSPAEVDACAQWLEWEIAQARPRVILAVGKTARAALGAIARRDIPVYEAWHPAYVLRNPKQRQAWLTQLAPAVAHALTGARAAPAKPSDDPAPWKEGEPDWRSPWLAVDTETDDLEEGYGKKLVCYQISDGEVAQFRKPASLLPQRHYWAHNIKYDAPLVGIDLRNLGAWDDTMLVAYVLRYERVGLKTLGPELTGLQMAPIKDLLQRREPILLKSGRQATRGGQPAFKTVKQSFSEALIHEPDRARQYALLDAVVTSRLARVLWPQLEAEPRLLHYYQQIEKPVVPILQEMEARGVLVDPDRLIVLGAEIAQRLAQHEEMARLALGVDETVNLGSTEQLAAALLDAGLPLVNRTVTGRLSVDEQSLLRAVGATTEQHVAELLESSEIDGRRRLHLALVRDILKIRELKKLQSTYVDALLNQRDAYGRVHARFNQTVTNTNRLSSSNPNLQNIPARDPLGKTIREAFIAPPGKVIVKADYSQLEIRIYAAMSGEKVLVDAYTHTDHDANGPDGECLRCDVHQQTATALTIPRKRAKNGFFAKLYGASDPKFCATCGVPPERAADFLARTKRSMPTLLTWQPRMAQEITQKGYIETLLGWRGYFPLFWSPVDRDRNDALREMANFPIQGTAAGIVKQLMIVADERARQLGAELILQVHDEVVYEVPEPNARRWAADLEIFGAQIGQDVGLTVPLKLNVEIGPSWGQTQDWRQWSA